VAALVEPRAAPQGPAALVAQVQGRGVAILTGHVVQSAAGTADGVTGIQMDIKIEGIDENIMRTALNQAKEGRLHILGEMSKAISQPKTEMSKFAPRITTITVPVDKIREVIGSGGKVIKEIVAQTGCKIDINDDGKINIATNDAAAAQKAIDIIKGIIAEVEVGKTYKGIVKKIVEFGAFVGVMPNQDGLLHISEIAHERVNVVTDFMKEGDEIEVKVIEVDKSGKIRLSRKALLPPPPGGAPQGGGDRGDRGPRGGDRGGPRGGDRGGPRGGHGGGDRRPHSQG
jgi:polyribonucleotide nucleotidyltransferase